MENDNQQSEDEFCIGAIGKTDGKDEVHATLQINRYPVREKLNTGAQVNGKPVKQGQKLKHWRKLLQNDAKLCGFRGNMLKVIGKFSLSVHQQTLTKGRVCIVLDVTGPISLS